MERQKALELIRSQVGNKNLIKHMLAAEACLRSLAQRFGEDQGLWAEAGLLHDVDYDQTAGDPNRHGVVGAAMLEDLGVAPSVIHSVKAHCGQVPAESRMDKALYAVDPLTGLIVAAALMHPTKKLRNVDVQFVLNRFGEKRFAAGANREQIRTCEQLGVGLDEFVSICLRAMQGISEELGL